jgi:hypothetical protein
MKSRTWTLGSVCSLFVVVLAAASTMYAAPIRVDCGRGGSIDDTLASLTSAGNTRGITIFVTGTCRKNIAISAFDHLTLWDRRHVPRLGWAVPFEEGATGSGDRLVNHEAWRQCGASLIASGVE